MAFEKRRKITTNLNDKMGNYTYLCLNKSLKFISMKRYFFLLAFLLGTFVCYGQFSYYEYRNGFGEIVFSTNSLQDAINYEMRRLSTNISSSVYDDWDNTTVEGFYVKLDCDDEEEAEVECKKYLGEYYECSGDYYAKVAVRSGTYEITLGWREDSRFYEIRNTRIYVRFRSTPGISRGDEGILDVWSNRGCLYEKPDQLCNL